MHRDGSSSGSLEAATSAPKIAASTSLSSRTPISRIAFQLSTTILSSRACVASRIDSFSVARASVNCLRSACTSPSAPSAPTSRSGSGSGYARTAASEDRAAASAASSLPACSATCAVTIDSKTGSQRSRSGSSIDPRSYESHTVGDPARAIALDASLTSSGSFAWMIALTEASSDVSRRRKQPTCCAMS